MVLIIDNYDSFTYNLAQQIGSLGHEVKVAKNDEITLDAIRTITPTHIVISPGPGRPESSGISSDVIQEFYKTTPILGVCLGMQAIGGVFGSKTIQAPIIVHGKAEDVFHDSQGIFAGVPSPFKVARYHSLAVDKLPKEFALTAWSSDKTIMAMAHKKYQIYGVQFHPESFMTDYGVQLMKNFLLCK